MPIRKCDCRSGRLGANQAGLRERGLTNPRVPYRAGVGVMCINKQEDAVMPSYRISSTSTPYTSLVAMPLLRTKPNRYSVTVTPVL